MSDPYQVVRDFEAALCEYTGAPYCVTTTSCTMALLLAVAWHLRNPPFISPYPVIGAWASRVKIEIPKRTYIGVPMSIIHAGGRPVFRDERWRGAYQLKPLPVWDSARYFTSGLYRGIRQMVVPHRDDPHSLSVFDLDRDCSGQMVCVSFHASKTLGDTQGGAILHDDPEADEWFRRARFDGRKEGVHPTEDIFTRGWHCHLSPDVAARLLLKLRTLPKRNDPIPCDHYPDLSLQEIFR